MAEDVLSNAPDAGTLETTTIFAVAQTTAGSKIQKIPLSSMTEVGYFIDVASEKTLMTPASFFANTASEARKGVIYVSSGANITGKTTNNALVASQIDDIASVILTPTKTIIDSDIDASTDGTIVISNLKQMVAGDTSMINGLFVFTPNVTNESVNIIINNVTPPGFIQGGSCTYYATDANRRISAGVAISSTGTNQMTVTIGKTESGQDFNNGVAHTMTLSLNFFI